MNRNDQNICHACGAEKDPDADRCGVCGVSRRARAEFARQVWIVQIILAVVMLIGLGVLYIIVSRMGIKDWF